MRILAVGNRYPPWSSGGYEVIWEGTVRALRDRGHAVRVLTTGPDPTDLTDAAPAGDVHRDLRWYWHNHAFPNMGLRRAASLERVNAAVLQRHLGALEPDVVMWWSMGGMSLSLIEQTRRAGQRALGVVCDDWLVYGPVVDGWIRHFSPRWARPLAPVAEHFANVPARVDIDAAGRWAFISEFVRGAARSAGYKLPDSVIAHAGVDPARFPRRDARDWAWRLLYTGRLDPRKGVETAVEALAQLPAEATLTINGDGSDGYRARLAGRAQQLGVAGRVHFRRSEHDEAAGVYADADVVLFPVMWQEPWGLVPLEAMSVGRPVVASSADGGQAEYLADGGNCLVFERGDATDLAAKVRRLANEPDLRGRLVTTGAQTAARFTEARFHALIERELEDVAAQRTV